MIMIEDIDKIDEIVGRLNTEIYNQTESNAQRWGLSGRVALEPFRLETDGSAQIVTFLGHTIWDSEWNDEYESLEDFLRKKTNDFISTLKTIKL
jgi:hypothetical protein